MVNDHNARVIVSRFHEASSQPGKVQHKEWLRTVTPLAGSVIPLAGAFSTFPTVYRRVFWHVEPLLCTYSILSLCNDILYVSDTKQAPPHFTVSRRESATKIWINSRVRNLLISIN